jgi:hypothetical protein
MGFVVGATPAAVERAFARHGLPVARVARPPQLCDRRACSSLDVWGGGGRVVFLSPPGKPAFFVTLTPSVSDAQKVANLEAKNPTVGALRHGSTLVLFLRSSTLLRRLRATLASLR